MKNLLISFSGGRSSGMMAYHIKNSPKYKDYNKLFIFANTGKGREETLEFVEECDNRFKLGLVWVEAVVRLEKGVGVMGITTDFKNASRKGEPFNAVIDKHAEATHDGSFNGVPNMRAPYCSSRLKGEPINKYAKEYFNKEKFITAVGMRYEDMPKRISRPELDLPVEERNYKIYPLLEDFKSYQTQEDVLNFWAAQPFDLGIDSKNGNCNLCWKKSDRKLIEVLRDEPNLVDWWLEQEQKRGTYFLRGNRSFAELLAESKKPKELSLFDNIGENCFCGG